MHNIFFPVTESRPGWLHALYALAICYQKLSAWNSCEQICRKGLSKVMPMSKPSIKIHLEEMLVESLIKQEHDAKLHDAADKCREVSNHKILTLHVINYVLNAKIYFSNNKATFQK